MSKEREDSSVNAMSVRRALGVGMSRASQGAAGQQGLNIQAYQGGGSSLHSAEGILHLAGAGSSSSSGGGLPSLQQYSHVHAQQQGGMQLMSSNITSAGASNMQMSMSVSNINTSTPCAACKLLRRRCAQECPFAPYFSPHEPQRFASVHKIYGASNVSKMLMEVPEIQRADVANSLVYEANARLRDPVYGCMGVVSTLQQQAQALQVELNVIRGEVMRYRACNVDVALQQHHHRQQKQQEEQQNVPLFSTAPSSSTITPPYEHHQTRGQPLSNLATDHYLSTFPPSNIPNSTSINTTDTKNHLTSWP